MTGKPINDSGMNCPLYRKPCSKVCHNCELWEPIRLQNPQTKEEIDRWQCSFVMATFAIRDVGRQTYSVGAAIESFRNEMSRQNEQLVHIDPPGIQSVIGKS